MMLNNKNQEILATTSNVVAEAYIDEAGEKGFLRNLTQSNDDKVAVIACVVIQQNQREELFSQFNAEFERFKAAGTVGNSSLHITDAYASGDAAWVGVATEVRTNIFALIKKHKIPVVYDARRLRVARESFQKTCDLVNQVRKNRRSSVKVSHRVSAERIDGECMIGIALKLDALATDFGFRTVDLLTDQMDRPIAQLFEEMRDKTKNISAPSERVVQGWDHGIQAKVSGTIRTSITDESGAGLDWLDAQHLRDIVVIGKDDPFVFAADVVVNALHHHLKNLSPNAPLNWPSSVANWELVDCVYGVRENAIEDII